MWINIAGAWVGNAGIYPVSTQYLLSIYTVSTQQWCTQYSAGCGDSSLRQLCRDRRGGGYIHLHSVALVATMGIHINSVKLTSLLLVTLIYY